MFELLVYTASLFYAPLLPETKEERDLMEIVVKYLKVGRTQKSHHKTGDPIATLPVASRIHITFGRTTGQVYQVASTIL